MISRLKAAFLMENFMISNYRDEPDKYLYSLVDDEGKIDIANFRTSIQKVIQANREYLLNISDLDSDIIIVVHKREKLILPSERRYFTEGRVFNILQQADKFGLDSCHVCNTDIFSNLPYEKINELTNYINAYLDKHIDNKGCYRVGERVQEITITKDEYTKYL